MRSLNRAAMLAALLLASCSETEEGEPLTIHTIRYEIDTGIGAERVPEITYTPYWSRDWGLQERVALLTRDPAVPWAYTFRSDHLRGFTVTAYGAIGLECWVFVDGEQVDYGHADNEVSCGVYRD